MPKLKRIQTTRPQLPIGRFLKSKSLGGNRVILDVRPFRNHGCCGATVDAGLKFLSRQQIAELAYVGSTPADIPFTSNMRHVRYRSLKNTVGLDTTIHECWEIDGDGYVTRLITIFPNGERLRYDTERSADHLGQLPDGIITDEDLTDPTYGECVPMSLEKFEAEWQIPAVN